ncbi:MAG: hypothetical protein R3268_14840, partial [Acidiferrobacterales bacterium]|nr:hypothetical protein [Acidiferrobacterales bacterium]
YRYEKSGQLFGLMRVRSMQMNDAHIYCTEEQFEEEQFHDFRFVPLIGDARFAGRRSAED